MDLSKIDPMINYSLHIIYNSEYGMVYSDSFVDENGIKLNRHNSDIVGKIMEERGLIKKNSQFFELTPKGIEIIESGGYLKHRNMEKGGIKNKQVTINSIKIKGDVTGSNINQDSDFLTSQIKNVPVEKTKNKSEKENEIWDRLKTIAMILAFITTVIGIITKLMDLW